MDNKIIEKYLKEEKLGMDAGEAQMWALINKGNIPGDFKFIESTASKVLKQIKMKKDIDGIVDLLQQIQMISKSLYTDLAYAMKMAKMR